MHRTLGIRVVTPLVLAAGIHVGLSQEAQGSTLSFSLKDDFSTVNNPNGAWSYNVIGAPIASQISGALGTGWSHYPNWDGSFIRAAAVPGAHDWEAGDILNHSYSYGDDDDDTSVTLTLPVAGILSLSGRVWDAGFPGGRDSSWVLTLNGVTVAERGSMFGLYRNDAAAQFSNNLAFGQSLTGIAVNAGDVIELRTHVTTTYGSFMGLDLEARVQTQTTVVPNPNSALLALAGLSSLVRVRRRRA